MSVKVLVTGGNGFVGKALVRALLAKDFQVHLALRSQKAEASASETLTACNNFIIGDLSSNINWNNALAGVDTVIHLAARVHLMQDSSVDPLMEYRKVNVDATKRLAEAATYSGVRRFIYLSSIKVNGERTVGDQQFDELSPANPQDAYGRSKWEAENALQEISARSNLEVVIIRPPLIYGQGVKANFAKLVRAVEIGMPLPFGRVHNRRSLIYVENLVNAIAACIHNENARNKTYLISDGEDVSTPELIRRLAATFNKKASLLPISPALLSFGGKLLGKQANIERLIGSLSVNNSKICRELNWTPPTTMSEAFRRDFA